MHYCGTISSPLPPSWNNPKKCSHNKARAKPISEAGLKYYQGIPPNNYSSNPQQGEVWPRKITSNQPNSKS